MKGIVESMGATTIEISDSYNPSQPLSVLWIYAEPEITSENFDNVILQETLQIFWDEYGENGTEMFFENIRQYDETIRATGAETVLFMAHISEYYGDDMTTLEDTADAHSQIGEELGIKVAPIGLATEIALQERPDLELFELDGVHPNWRGTYLAALELYATIYEENPAGIPYQPGDRFYEIESFAYRADEWRLTEDEMNFLQRIPWETVISYPASGVTE